MFESLQEINKSCLERKLGEPPLFRLLCSVKTGTALDLGCGRGKVMQLLTKKGYETIGLDISSSKLRRAVKIGYVLHADCHYLPFKNESFNLVFIKHLLHHIEKPEKTLIEVSRLLKDDGVVYIAEIVEDNPLLRLGRDVHPFWKGEAIKTRLKRKELRQIINKFFGVIKEDFSGGNIYWIRYVFASNLGLINNLTKLMRFIDQQMGRISKNCFSCTYNAIMVKINPTRVHVVFAGEGR